MIFHYAALFYAGLLYSRSGKWYQLGSGGLLEVGRDEETTNEEQLSKAYSVV